MACGKYAPAKMDQRVTLQSVARASDSQGGWTDTWNNGASLWASIDQLKGYERMQAQQLQTPITHKVMIRYNADVTTANRLLYGTRVLNIKEVIELQPRKSFMQLLCVETV